MFDVSLVELAVIALVALLVLGPEKLPRAARTVGLYVRKAKQSWYSVRGEIERELAADELKRSLKRAGDSVRDAAQGVNSEVAAARASAKSTMMAVTQTATPASAPEPESESVRDEPPAA